MPELYRNRDCVVLAKGDTFTVNISDELVQNGWKGGQGVQYASRGKDELLVERSTGLYAGFLFFGSDEIPDRYTAMTGNQLQYRYSVVGAGGWVIMTTTFEKYTYASRIGPGPLVPITYTASGRLVFSLRGILTSEDEWTLSGDPRGANDYFIAFVVQAPTVANNSYMTVQVSI